MAENQAKTPRHRRRSIGGVHTAPSVLEVLQKELEESNARRATRLAARSEELQTLEQRLASVSATPARTAAARSGTPRARNEAPSLPPTKPTIRRPREYNYSPSALEHINAVRAEARSAYQQDLIARYSALDENIYDELPPLAEARDRIEDQLATYYVEPEIAFAHISDSLYVNGVDETIDLATFSPEVFGELAPGVDPAERMDQLPTLATQIQQLNDLQLELAQSELAHEATQTPTYTRRARTTDRTAERLEEITLAHQVSHSLDERRARLIAAKNEVRESARDYFVAADAQRFIREFDQAGAVELRTLASNPAALVADRTPRDFSVDAPREIRVPEPAPAIVQQLSETPSFRGPLSFLSNMHPAPVTLDGETYPTVEHAFAAAKTLDAEERARIRQESSAAAARRIGERVSLRENWDAIKKDVMEDLLRQKFSDPALRTQLLATGNATLIERNNWGDRYWGVADGTGENHLGHLLSQIRAEYQHQALTRGSGPAGLSAATIDVPRIRMTDGRPQSVTTGPTVAADFVPKHGLVLAGTGHRPNKITLPDGTNAFETETYEQLVDFATQIIERERPAFGISGMAGGWDQALAEAFERTGTPWVAAVPFEGQERNWPKEAQKRYHELLAKAEHVHVVSSGSYERWMMDERNQWMVNNSTAMIALWDGSNGGTRNALDYAATTKMPTLNVWDEWQAFSERPGQQIDPTPKLPALLEERGISTRIPSRTQEEALQRLQDAVSHAADTLTRYDLAHSRAAAALGTPAVRASSARLLAANDAFIQQALKYGIEPAQVQQIYESIDKAPEQTQALIQQAIQSVSNLPEPNKAERDLAFLADHAIDARKEHAELQRVANGRASRAESGRFIEREIERRQEIAAAQRLPSAIAERRLSGTRSMPHRRPLDCISCGATKLGSNRGRDFEGYRLDVDGNRVLNPEELDKSRLKPAGERDHGLCKTCFEQNGPLASQKLALTTHTTALEATTLRHTNDQAKNLRPAEQQLREQQWQAMAEQIRARYAELYPLGVDPSLGMDDGPLANVERLDRWAEELDTRGAFEDDNALDYLLDGDNAFDEYDRYDAFIEAIEDRWFEGQIETGIGNNLDLDDAFRGPAQKTVDRAALDASSAHALEAIEAVRGERDALLKNTLVEYARSRFAVATNANLRTAFDRTLGIDTLDGRRTAREQLIEELGNIDRAMLRAELRKAQGYNNPFMTPEQRAAAIEERVSTILSNAETGLGAPKYNGYSFRGPDESFGKDEMSRAVTMHQQRLESFLKRNEQTLEAFEKAHGILNPTREIIASAQEVRPGVTIQPFEREARDRAIAEEIATFGRPSDERIRAAFDDYLANVEALGRRSHAPFPQEMPDLIEQMALRTAGFTDERMAYLEDARRMAQAAEKQGFRIELSEEIQQELAAAEHVVEPYRTVYAEYRERFEQELAAKHSELGLDSATEPLATEKPSLDRATDPVQAIHESLAAVQQHETLTRKWNETIRRGDEAKQLLTAIENASKTHEAARATLASRLANLYTKPEAVLDALDAATPEKRKEMIDALRRNANAFDSISPLKRMPGSRSSFVAETDRNTRAAAVLMDSYHHARSGTEATHVWAAKHLGVEATIPPTDLLEHINKQYQTLRSEAREVRNQLTALGTPPTTEMLREQISRLSPEQRTEISNAKSVIDFFERTPQARSKTAALAL